MAFQLRGGLGEVTVGYNTRKLKPTKKNNERELQAVRAARAAQYDLEAEHEAAAIRQHRAITPARQIANGRAV